MHLSAGKFQVVSFEGQPSDLKLASYYGDHDHAELWSQYGCHRKTTTTKLKIKINACNKIFMMIMMITTIKRNVRKLVNCH